MRTLYRASLAILLTDMYTKEPIANAVILCDGKQIRYSKATGGYYAFSNLYPKKYRVDIICKGFLDIRLDLEVRANETKTIMMNLPYALDNAQMQREKRFEIQVNKDGMPWKDSNVRFKLVDDLNFLKVLQPVKKRKNKIVFNMENNKSFVFQRYAYRNQGTENEFYIYGYDISKSDYFMKDPAEVELSPGGKLYPIWDLKTDENGKVILPIFRQFMKGSKARFEVFAGGKYAKMKLSVPEIDDSEKLIIAETDLTELEPKKLPKTLQVQEEESNFDDMEEGDVGINFSAMLPPKQVGTGEQFAISGPIPMLPNNQPGAMNQLKANGQAPMPPGAMGPPANFAPNGQAPMPPGAMGPPDNFAPNGQAPMPPGAMGPPDNFAPNGQAPMPPGAMGPPDNFAPNGQAPMPPGAMNPPDNFAPNGQAPMPPGAMNPPDNFAPNGQAPMPPGAMNPPDNFAPNGQAPMPPGAMGPPNNFAPNGQVPMPPGAMNPPDNFAPNGQAPMPPGAMGPPDNFAPNGQAPMPPGAMGPPANFAPNGQVPMPPGAMGPPANSAPNGQVPMPPGAMGPPANSAPNGQAPMPPGAMGPPANSSIEDPEAESLEDGIHEFKKKK